MSHNINNNNISDNVINNNTNNNNTNNNNTNNNDTNIDNTYNINNNNHKNNIINNINNNNYNNGIHQANTINKEAKHNDISQNVINKNNNIDTNAFNMDINVNNDETICNNESSNKSEIVDMKMNGNKKATNYKDKNHNTDEDVIMVEKSEDLPEEVKLTSNITRDTNDKNKGDQEGSNMNNNIRTEKLTYLDPSFIAEKNIRNVKKKNKENRINDIKQKVENLPNNKQSETSATRNARHIQLMETFGEYCIQDLIKEVASTDVITKLIYLLDFFPKFRTEFLKALKLTPKQTMTNVMTIISKLKIIKVSGKVEDKDCEIFLDICASVNVITRTALNKLQINKPSVGRISETIFQAYSNSSIDSDIYNLKVSIGSRTFNEYFRVIGKDDIFDILIGVDSLKNNRFDINLVGDTLYYIDENNKYISLTDLLYDINLNQNSDEAEEYINPNSEPLLLTITINNDQIDNTVGETVNLKEKLINDIISSSPEKIKNKINKLFSEFKDVIAIKTDNLCKSKLLPHKIELLPNTTPIKLKLYRLSKSQMVALKKILAKLKENKLIISSNSIWSFPVVLVPKKNNDWRMCVDYRQLNNVTIKDSYALPLIDEIFMFIGKNAKVLSTIDLFSGYHQIPMHIDDQDKATFTTMFGNYKFCVTLPLHFNAK